LNKDFSELLKQGLHSDVTLFVDGVEFPAHRSILSARSPVLKAMFSHDMKESKEGTVEIEEIKAPVFKQLLNFIYTGECSFKNEKYSKSGLESKAAKQEEIIDMPAHLLAAADRFQLPLLADLAADEMMASITVETVADRLLMADACHAPNLKKRCLEFIRADTRRMAQIKDTDGYQKMSKAQVDEIMSALFPMAPGSSKKRPREEDDAEKLTKDKVKKLKLSELKEELSARGLDTSGLKKDLVERLENSL
jgi:speckle-type POZ protein